MHIGFCSFILLMPTQICVCICKCKFVYFLVLGTFVFKNGYCRLFYVYFIINIAHYKYITYVIGSISSHVWIHVVLLMKICITVILNFRLNNWLVCNSIFIVGWKTCKKKKNKLKIRWMLSMTLLGLFIIYNNCK